MKFQHRGVTAQIPEAMLADARDCMGIDIPSLLKASIDRMLYVSEQTEGNFVVAMQIKNPSCDPHSCDFHIRVFRINY
jgi:hypothetical protein